MAFIDTSRQNHSELASLLKTLLRLLALLALALAWLGYFSPWIAPKPVGLQLSAHDMVEWMTFVQTVRDGTFPVTRLDLSLPLAGLALLVALTPAVLLTSPVRFPFWIGLPFLALGLFSALLIQPPYPFVLTAYNDPELAPQFWLGVAAFILVSPLALFACLRPQWAKWAASAIALASLAFSWHAYSIIQPPLTDVLTKPAPVGYGFVLCMIGLGALLLLPIASIRSPQS